MKIPSFFMGKIIVTLFPFTDIPSGINPSAAKSSVLTRHTNSALNRRKVPKMPCFCGFYGVGSNEPVDEPSGFKRRGKIKLYQCRSYYAPEPKNVTFRLLFLCPCNHISGIDLCGKHFQRGCDFLRARNFTRHIKMRIGVCGNRYCTVSKPCLDFFAP